MSERIFSLLSLSVFATNGILLAIYYHSYQLPKSEKIPGKLVFIAFGGAYFGAQFLVYNLLDW